MELIYSKTKVEKICKNYNEAKKYFGGNEQLARSLIARINALQQADTIKDIVNQAPFRFHNLKGNLDGYFAIDVKSKRDAWRIIIQPLDNNKKVFKPCYIDQIVDIVRIVVIKEVSNHYE